MKFKMKRCPKCKRYTLKETCPVCNIQTVTAHPARFSPDDKYLLYKVRMLIERRRNV